MKTLLRIIAVIVLLGSPLLLGWLVDKFTGFPIIATLGGIGFILLFIIGMGFEKDNAMGAGCLFILYFIIFLFFGPAIISRLHLASHDIRGVYYSEDKTDTLRITGSTRHKVVLEFKGEKIPAKVKGQTIYVKDGTVISYSEWDEQSPKPDETIVHCKISGKLKGNTISLSNQFIRITTDYVPVGEMIN
jgi:hypothetical protein